MIIACTSFGAQAQNTFPSSGGVGIGTTSPQEALHINGNIRGNQSGAIRIRTTTGYVDIGSKNTNWAHFNTDRPRYYFDKEIRVNSGYIGSYDENLFLRTSGSTRLTIKNSNGDIGIGTTSPTAKLHINKGATGDAILKIESDTDNSGSEDDHPQLQLIQDGGAVVGIVGYETVGSDNNQLIIENGWNNVAADIMFRRSGTTNMIIEGGGNVGIGTTNPSHKLTVAGTINSREIIVEETAGADFVFADDYDLSTLEEIEAFISQNNHLPGIAPATEMIEEGVKVGELQIQLLQKIEELTLHVIQLNKENQALKQRVQQLEEN